MVFPVVGGTQDTGAYEIDNSLRFNDDDGAYLQRTAGANTGEDNATLSFWFKLSAIKTDNNGGTIMTEGGTTGNHVIQIYANKIYIGSGAFGIMFPNLIRDPSAWYHLFIAFDTSQSTNTNRVKAYLNGVLLTDATGFTDYPDQNENLGLCVNGNTTRIGSRGNSGAQAFDGYLAEFHFLDGTTKAYTDFGEFNDNGVWIPKKYTGGSYGDNGFYLEFKQTGTSADASGIGADTSGEGHHFSVSSVVATDVTTDTPTNNFATLNTTANFHVGATYQEGATRYVSDESKYGYAVSTIGVPNGKWYAEFKMISKDGESGNWYMVGVAEGEQRGHRLVLGRDTNYPSANQKGGVGYVGYGTNFVYQNDAYYNNDSNSYSTAAFADGDIIGVALNADDYQVTFYKNGTVQNSGTAFELGNFNVYGNPDLPVGSTGFWHFGCGHFDTGNTFTIDCNFGNAPFSISSGNADANGYGNFEYSVPTNYYALCTKNLAEFG